MCCWCVPDEVGVSLQGLNESPRPSIVEMEGGQLTAVGQEECQTPVQHRTRNVITTRAPLAKRID